MYSRTRLKSQRTNLQQFQIAFSIFQQNLHQFPELALGDPFFNQIMRSAMLTDCDSELLNHFWEVTNGNLDVWSFTNFMCTSYWWLNGLSLCGHVQHIQHWYSKICTSPVEDAPKKNRTYRDDLPTILALEPEDTCNESEEDYVETLYPLISKLDNPAIANDLLITFCPPLPVIENKNNGQEVIVDYVKLPPLLSIPKCMVFDALFQMPYVHRKFKVIYKGITELHHWNWQPRALLNNERDTPFGTADTQYRESFSRISGRPFLLGQTIWIGRREWSDRDGSPVFSSSGTPFSALVTTPVMPNPERTSTGIEIRGNSPNVNLELDASTFRNSPLQVKSGIIMTSPEVVKNYTDHNYNDPQMTHPFPQQLFKSVYTASQEDRKRQFNGRTD